ncbi:hypothetical protein NUSPORA_00567 [Nucleospora cyclopteri]
MYNIILPTYNESVNIVPMIGLLTDVFNKMEQSFIIIVVDDNSPDQTAGIVEKLKNPNVKLIKRKQKLGLGSAYKTAAKECHYKYTIIIDSDLQHSPLAILGMSKLLNKADIITGTRYISKVIDDQQVIGKVCGWNFYRKLVSATANNLARYILDLKTTDLTGSFRIYKTEVFKKLVKMVHSNGFGFQVEIIALAEKNNCNIEEFPIVFYNRRAGESKLNSFEIFRFIFMIIVLYFRI